MKKIKKEGEIYSKDSMKFLNNNGWDVIKESVIEKK